MAINKKLITFASKSTFTGANGINGKTSPTNGCYGNIPSTSIVFILDTGEIWTHGKYISGGVWGTKQDNYVPLKIAGTEYNLSLNGHKQSYTTLTGSTTTANQAIVSNGTANGWTLKTLGSRAFDSTSYLPVAGGALSGDVYFKFTATNSDTYPTGTFPKLIWSGSSDSIQLFANVATDNNMLLHINHDDDGDEGTIMTWAGVTKITFAKTYIQAPTFKNSNGTEVSYAGHTHTTGLAADTGTAAITLKHGSTYKLSTGGTSVIFKMPTDNNTTYNFSGTTFYSGNSNTAEHDANNAVKNGHYYYQSNGPATSIGASTDDGALYVQSYSDSWVGQIAQDYRNGRLFFRGKNNGTWQPWLTNIDSGNYTNYAATKDHTHSLYLTAHQDISGKVNKSGDTMAGLLTLANGLNKGIKFANGTTIQTAGTSDGGPVMLSGYLRFSTGSSWDYSAWAGLGYDTTNKIIYLGIPGDGTVFLKNSAVNTGGTLLLVNVSSLKLDGNKGNSYTVYHSGNLSSLKNPNSLTIQTSGTSLGSYDGSGAKTWNITYSNIGAAAASHTHNYLPLSGGTIDSTSFAPVTIYRNGSTNAAAIAFKNSNGTLNYFGATLTINGQFRRWLGNNTNTSYEILDSSTTNISNGVIKINGTTITPLTSHQSLADYYKKSEITTLLSDKSDTTHSHGLLHSNFTTVVANTTTDSGWSMINSSYNGFILKSLRMNANAPNWLLGNYSAGIAFGGYDTKGVLSVSYYTPLIRFAGGNGTTAVWYITLTGASGKSYNLNNFLTSHLSLSEYYTKKEVDAKLSNKSDAGHTHDYRANTQPVSGAWFNGTPLIGGDGVMEIGKFIDFHYTNTSTADYSTRLMIQDVSGITVTLPSKSGTLALTSNIPSSLKNPNSLFWTDSSGTSQSYDGSAAKTLTINYATNSDTVDSWHKDNINWTGYVTSPTSGLSSYWGKIWDATVTQSLYNDITVTFLISANYYPSYHGIVVVGIRQQGTNSSGAYNLVVSLKEISGNIPSTALRLYYDNSTGSCQLWGNIGSQYGTINTTVLKKSYRTATDSSSIGTLYLTNFTTAQTLPTSSYIEMSYNYNYAKAVQLNTSRTIWGQSFDGTANVSGNMTGVGSINTKSSPASTIYTNNWFRSVGASGWYSESYGGGWYMKDSTWIRNFGTKAVYLDANLCSGAKIGIGTTSPSYLLDVAGKARITGPLLINGGESNYCEGIRIASNSNGWATIILKGSDNTSDSGTSTSSWSIHNYNGWYYINKNGSSDLKATRLWGHDNGWTIGNTSTTSYPLNVGGDIYSSGYARAASGFVKTNGTAAQVLRADGGVASFNWSGLGGQPTWLWGGNSQHTYYVYNPSNFSVKYATSAGNADTLDSKHWSNIKIGGRNYFKQSSGCSGITKDSSINGGYASVAAGNQIRIQNFGSDGIDSDWTVSFYIKASNATTCDIDMCDIGPNSSYNESNSMSVTTSYVKHTFTFLNVCQYHTSSSYNGFIDIYSSAAATIYLKDIKIERGTIATDWSLAPEDAANIHNHTWASITDKIVAGNEFNIVNSGYNSTMWFNYLPCDDRNKTAAVSLYIMGNGNKGYASVKASTYYNSSGTEVSYSGHTHTFASLTNKPTTLAGYGITDAASSGHNHDGRYLGLSGGTMSGAVYSTFTSNTWINGVSNAVINLNNSGYGAAISMPVNSGRVSISTYAASTNNVYFGYASSTQIANGTNSFTTQMYWDAPNNILYANTFSGALSGNASSATKLTTDAGGSTTPVYFSGGKPVACTAYSSASVNYANSANKATYVVDYASTDNTIKIGYKTASLTASEVGYVCVFASDISNGVRIKDIGQSEFLKWLALPFSSLTSVPTTLTGYGITDGVNAVTTIGDISASISGHTLTIKYSGSSTPTQGVYILANGSLTNYSSWNTANNSKAVAVALVAETNTIFIALVDHETTEPWMESYGYTVCSGQYTTAATVRTDNNGYGNSTCISSEDTNGTSAAYIADNDDELYLSSGLTSRGFIGAGYEWYLIYQNITAINAALTKCGGTALSDVYYWTSTEYNGNYAWAMNPKTNVWTYAIKSNNYKARSFYE